MGKRPHPDEDYLFALLHGRHGKMAIGERLSVLCRIRTLPELARALWRDFAGGASAGELQRRLYADYLGELEFLAQSLRGARRGYFGALAGLRRRAFAHSSLKDDMEKSLGRYGLLLEAASLCGPDEELLASHEAATFSVVSALRLKFNYSLPPEAVMECNLPSRLLSGGGFEKIMASPGLEEALPAAGAAIAPHLAQIPTISALERGALERFNVLSERVWRVNPPAGYAGLRRIEVANLVTLSEGIRLGMESRRLAGALVGYQANGEQRYA